MIFDIKSLGGLKAADKTKAKGKVGSTGGPSFADMLDSAQAADAPASEAPVGALAGLAPGFVPIEEDIPQDPKGRAKELLKTLESLAQDALGGSPTAVAGRLEALAASVDESSLNADQKQALDEVRTRAAVEVAKLKG